MSGPIVCILTAGIGSRLEHHSKQINKALLPVNNQSCISRIIANFPSNSRFIIALGYKADQVTEFLQIAESDKDITYVTVDPYNGDNSGPGQSIRACQKEIDGGFYLVCCDTLWDSKEDISITAGQSWIGTSKYDKLEGESLCRLQIVENKVAKFIDKSPEPHQTDYFAFNGLAYIGNPKLFFSGLNDQVSVAGEFQLSSRFQALLKNDQLFSRRINSWVDVGKIKNYIQANKNCPEFNFQKKGQYFYAQNDLIIKFFENPKENKQRIMRAQYLRNSVPAIKKHGEQFYSYDYIDGKTFYQAGNPELFKKLLSWLETKVWKPIAVDQGTFQGMCKQFYYNKTNDRVKRFLANNRGLKIETINKKSILSWNDLRKLVPWENLYNGSAHRIHGDLHFDNIIIGKEDSSLTLIDWRQDFSGSLKYGDIYYDLAKLFAGIEFNFNTAKRGLFKISNESGHLEYNLTETVHQAAYEEVL